MTAFPKVLFLAMDAGDRDLIRSWTEDGVLGNIRRLQESGVSMDVRNSPGLFVGSVWPTFATGLPPSRHGRYCYDQLRAGSYETPRFPVAEIEGEPFWDVLSRKGQRVAIVDAPKTRLSEGINGVHLVDWGTHDPVGGFSTWPKELAEEVLRDFGPDPLGGTCDAMRSSAEEFAALRDVLVGKVQKRAELAARLLAREPWDLFFVNFSESHCAGHQLWHLHDSAHDRHAPEIVRTIGNPLRDVYREIDLAIGRLVKHAGPETVVCLLASHGMGPHYDATALLEEMLRRLENHGHSGPRRRLAGFAMRCWTGLPADLRHRFKPLRELAQGFFGPVLPALGAAYRQRSFQVPNNDAYGGIRINVVGREPHGRIRDGAAYQAYCEELRADLMEFVNEETGRPLVEEVLLTRDIYKRENLDRLPDLIVAWDRKQPISSVYSPKAGRITRPYTGNRTGDHTNEGALFASGPGIPQRAVANPVSMEDIAPTVARLLGITLPDVDGRPIDAIGGAPDLDAGSRGE